LVQNVGILFERRLIILTNIEYSANINILYYNYKEILGKKITEVCNKIGFDDPDILWFIYDPNKPVPEAENHLAGSKRHSPLDEIKRQINKVLGQKIRSVINYYGYCFIKEKKIWISIASIMKDSGLLPFNNPLFKNYSRISGSDFLADVIIDEITHIQTGCDHGDPKYDTQRQKNTERYYTTIFDRILLKKAASCLSIDRHF